VVVLVVAAGLGAPVAGASAPAADRPAKDVRIVDINLLHGTFCPRDTDNCDAPDRVALLLRQLEDAGCPPVVGLEEISLPLAAILERQVPKACAGRYRFAFHAKPRTGDTEQVLTSLPIESTKVEVLVGGFRNASRVVLRSALGPVVLVVTHQDGDPPEGLSTTPCKRCVPPCKKVHASALVCQTVAAAALADEAPPGPKAGLRVLMGDFNFTATSPRYQTLTTSGWIDSHTAAGNAECDPATGTECTSGRDDQSLPTLQDPNAKESERIDFIFVKGSRSCAPAFDTAADADGDGLGTGLFHPAPAVDGPGGLAWPSDHTGVMADLSCSGKGKGTST